MISYVCEAFCRGQVGLSGIGRQGEAGPGWHCAPCARPSIAKRGQVFVAWASR